MREPYFRDDSVTLYHGDALEVAREMGDGSVDCIVTSPPYYALRDYGIGGQYGLESSPAEYVETMRLLHWYFKALAVCPAKHGQPEQCEITDPEHRCTEEKR